MDYILKFNFKKFFCFILFSFSVALYSGESYKISREDAIDICLKNNLELKAKEKELNSKLNSKNRVWNDFIPNITGSMSISRQNDSVGSMGAMGDNIVKMVDLPEWNLSFNIQATLTLNATIFMNIKNSSLNYQSGSLSFEDLKSKISRDVSKLYYNLIILKEYINIAQKSLEISKKRYNQAEVNYKNGLIADTSYLQSKVTYENLKPKFATAKIDYETALLNFKILLGLNMDDSVEIIMEDLNFKDFDFNLDVAKLSEKYIQDRTDIQSIKSSLEQLKFNKKMVYAAGFSPNLILQGAYRPARGFGFSDPDLPDYDKWKDSGAISIGISIPVDKYIPATKTWTEAENIQNSIDALEINLKNSIQMADLQIRTIVMKIDKSIENLSALESSEKLAKKVYERYEAGYNAGNIEILDLEKVHIQENEAILNFVAEKVNLYNNIFDLEYAINSKIIDKGGINNEVFK